MSVKHFHRGLLTIFLIGLFFMPFIFWPTAIIPYEMPRVWFVLRWIELLTILAATGVLFGAKTEKGDIIITLLCTVFVIFAILSSVSGSDFTKSLWGNYYRGDGLIMLIHLATLSTILTLYANHSWVEGTAKTISVSALLIGLWTIFQGFQTYVLGHTVSLWGEAIAVSFGNPNFLTGYLLVTLPFLGMLLVKSKSKKEMQFWALAILIQSLAILLTLSRAGIIGIILFIVGYLLITQKSVRKSLVVFPTLALILITIFFINSYKKSYNPYIIVAESRQRIFTKAILAWKEKPLTGFGWANFDHAFESVQWPIMLNDDVYVDKAHSHILEILTTTGSLGLAIYLTLVSAAGINLYKAKTKQSKFLLFALILYLLHSQMNITSVAEEVIFWTIIGFSAVTWKGGQPNTLSKKSGG